MPRSKRLVPLSDAALHIMARGNNGATLFKNNIDKTYYLCFISEFSKENGIDVFHYCLMNNHIHLVVWLHNEHKLSRFMKQLQLKYFTYYKNNYGHTGHLWQGRYKSNIIDTDSHLLQCGKYIELNPVRADMVPLPEVYVYSSYRYYAEGASDPLITPNPVYLGLSNNPKERKRQYIDFVTDNKIINKRKLEAQLFIGSERFIRKLEEYYKIKNTA